MELLFDEDGHAVVKEGEGGKKLPVYKYEDGTEKEFDAHATLEGLTKKLNAEKEEKQRHFDKAKEYEDRLKSFEGIEDVEKAKDALRVVKNLSDKKLLDEKGVEAVKEEVRQTMKALAEEKEEALKAAHTTALEERDNIVSSQKSLIRNLVIDNLFANSDYFSGEDKKTIYPADDAAKIFGHHFSLEVGDDNRVNVTAKDLNGKTIMSRVEHGEPADFNEAIGLIIDKHPRKHEILRSGKSGGPGSDGNLDHKGKDFEKMSPAEKIASGLKRHYRETGKKI